MRTLSNYIICATPRSGSNLLCELLSSLAFAGRPEEHLWDPARAVPDPLSERWPRVLRAGTGVNGVFATKVLWYQAECLERDLPAVLGMPGESLAHVFDVTLGNPKYFYLTRSDHLRQAVSFVRAMQTSQWRSTDSARCTPKYDAGAIADAMNWFDQNEGRWEGFFLRNRLSPYRLTYEELDSAPEETIAALLVQLGHNDQAPVHLGPTQHRHQADELTDEWIRRFTRERCSESLTITLHSLTAI